MATVSFSIPDLFQIAFGYKSTAFEFPLLPGKKQFADLGSPYYQKDAQGRDYYMPVKLGGLWLPHPVIRVTGGKSIVETEVTEVRGTVKELISVRDYQITIRGLIIDKDKEYPETVVSDLRELLERKEALELQSAITDIFLVHADRAGYDKAVVYEWDFPEVTGVTNVRPYQLMLKSDDDFDMWID
jgi:hypothetical protein